MPVSIVVGGQFGSEGKGKIAHFLAQKPDVSIAVRCGGTNSGHTVIDKNGIPHVFRQLPTAAILGDLDLALCAGSYVDLEILSKEMKTAKVNPKRLIIDPHAVIITDELKEKEASSGLIAQIGSTGSGTGAAVMARIQRQKVIFAKDIPHLADNIKNVNEELHNRIKKRQRIVIEGTQGFGLSPLHSGLNPFVTSRDTTAAGFLSEVGLSPLEVDEIILVIRALPIRVGGSSGPLPNEIDWNIVSNESGIDCYCEKTSVTKKIRRVARFNADIVNKAIIANSPSTIIMNHVDLLPKSVSSSEFIKIINSQLISDINYIGTGRCDNDITRVS